MKTLLVLSMTLISTAAFAKMEPGSYEVCKGEAKGGVGVTLTGNYNTGDVEDIAINANGERVNYKAEPTENCGDVHECYESKDHGGLKVTFYDEDNSASGWSADLGAFRLKCQDNK